MRTSKASLALCAIATTIAFSGCTSAEDHQQQLAAQKAAKAAKVKKAKAKAAYAACDEHFSKLLKALDNLNSRLDVGLNYSQYGSKVGDAKVAYDAAFKEETSSSDSGGAITCLTSVGLPAEKALNSYYKASNAWTKCFDDYACDDDTVKPKLQKYWGRAALQTERANAGLKSMEPS
jgi:hypothetical protein